MKILMTGTTGFVGSYFIENMSAGHEIYALGRKLPKNAGSHVTLIPCDLASPNALSDLRTSGALPDKIDAVIHMAVSRLHRDFPDSAIDLFSVNCWALQQLLEYARHAGAKSFVVGSTCSVYDGLPTDAPIKESVVPNPTRYWPATKYAADLIALKYKTIFPVSILRFATPFGPGQYDRLIPELIRRVTNDIAITLPPQSEGIMMRPIYVSDAAAVMWKAAEDGWTGVYNVAGEQVFSLKKIAELIGEITNRKVSFEISSSAANYAVIPDVEKLHGSWSGEAFLPFRDGLSRTIEAG